MSNDAFTAAEARWLQEPDRDECDRCDRDAEPGSALCAVHEDEAHEHERAGDMP